MFLYIELYKDLGSLLLLSLVLTMRASAMVCLTFFFNNISLPHYVFLYSKKKLNCPGFNCGEAVNFAIGDWFPLGSLASKRYTLLNRTPLLAHEELLCHSAVLLSQKLLTCDLGSLDKSEHPYSQYCMKSCFVRLMRFQRRARSLLAKMGSQICYKPKTFPNLSCSMCRRDCYITHVLCGCNFDPVCLHHGNLC